MMDVKRVAYSMALLGIFIAVTAWVWHGLLGQASMAGLLYPWFSYTNPTHLALLAFLLAVLGALYGSAFAWIYNWMGRAKR